MADSAETYDGREPLMLQLDEESFMCHGESGRFKLLQYTWIQFEIILCYICMHFSCKIIVHKLQYSSDPRWWNIHELSQCAFLNLKEPRCYVPQLFQTEVFASETFASLATTLQSVSASMPSPPKDLWRDVIGGRIIACTSPVASCCYVVWSMFVFGCKCWCRIVCVASSASSAWHPICGESMPGHLKRERPGAVLRKWCFSASKGRWLQGRAGAALWYPVVMSLQIWNINGSKC